MSTGKQQVIQHLHAIIAYFREWKVDAKEIDNLTLADVRYLLDTPPVNLDHFAFREACNNAIPTKTE